MNTSPPVTQPSDPRRRLRELLSVPERDRTEEQWDEINELEIQLAPGNRAGMTGLPSGKSNQSSAGNNSQQQPRKHRPKTGNPGNSGNNGNTGNTGGAPRRPNKPNKPPRDPA